MPLIEIRRLHTIIEEIRHEGGPPPDEPLTRGAILVVMNNPYAGRYVPIHHINACYVRSHFDAMEVGVPGAPHGDEIVFVLVMTTGGRIHARVGGLKAPEIKGEDGLR